MRRLLEVLLQEAQIARCGHGVRGRRHPLHLFNLTSLLVDYLLGDLAPATLDDLRIELVVDVLPDLQVLVEHTLKLLSLVVFRHLEVELR